MIFISTEEDIKSSHSVSWMELSADGHEHQ